MGPSNSPSRNGAPAFSLRQDSRTTSNQNGARAFSPRKAKPPSPSRLQTWTTSIESLFNTRKRESSKDRDEQRAKRQKRKREVDAEEGQNFRGAVVSENASRNAQPQSEPQASDAQPEELSAESQEESCASAQRTASPTGSSAVQRERPDSESDYSQSVVSVAPVASEERMSRRRHRYFDTMNLGWAEDEYRNAAAAMKVADSPRLWPATDS